jgi:hypothetical protein
VPFTWPDSAVVKPSQPLVRYTRQNFGSILSQSQSMAARVLHLISSYHVLNRQPSPTSQSSSQAKPTPPPFRTPEVSPSQWPPQATQAAGAPTIPPTPSRSLLPPTSSSLKAYDICSSPREARPQPGEQDKMSSAPRPGNRFYPIF